MQKTSKFMAKIPYLYNLILKLKNKKLKELRSQWARPLNKFRNFDLISTYLQKKKSEAGLELVDFKTWTDLNFDSIFAKLDRNITGIGEQYLFYLLHKYESDENVLIERIKLIETLKSNQKLREDIQLKLLRLSGRNSYFIPYIIFEKNLPFTKFFRLFYILSVLPLLSIILFNINSAFWFLTFGLLFINLLINKIFSKKTDNYSSGFSALNSLIVTAKMLTKIKTDKAIKDLNYLKGKKVLLKKLGKRLGFLVIDTKNMSQLIAITVEYFNVFMLMNLITYFRSVSILQKQQKNIQAVYEAVANLDVSISIASFLEDIGNYSIPVFNNEKFIKFENLRHPLIENAVPNTMKNKLGKSVLITGSNMSGKTTFIKNIGVNIILSRTLNFSLADEFNIHRFIVKSAIERTEDLEGGKSYFFGEVNELKNLISLSEKNDNYLFLIDEIFRGTNTIERLAASTAVLKFLDRQNRTFVTTHDIELQYLLQNKFEMFHFSEQVENGKYFFDYKIHNGPAKSGNAIKLLEIKNYPESLTKEAFEIVKKLVENNYFDEVKFRSVIAES